MQELMPAAATTGIEDDDRKNRDSVKCDQILPDMYLRLLGSTVFPISSFTGITENGHSSDEDPVGSKASEVHCLSLLGTWSFHGRFLTQVSRSVNTSGLT